MGFLNVKEMVWVNDVKTASVIETKKLKAKLRRRKLKLVGEYFHFNKGSDRFWYKACFVADAYRKMIEIVGFPIGGLRVFTFVKKYNDGRRMPILVLHHKKVSGLIAPFDDKYDP